MKLVYEVTGLTRSAACHAAEEHFPVGVDKRAADAHRAHVDAVDHRRV